MAASPAPDSPLDSEIARMHEQIESLERRRSILSSTLLSSQNTLSRIQRANTGSHPSATGALAAIEKQQRHNLENLHRTCAGATAFRVKDPDPCAVDDGRILGVRIEVSVKGRFAAPYYLLLNRSSSGSENLRIHKHTIPPCIPLHGYAAKYLPQQDQPQDLHRLVRELRQELVSHHLRLNAVGKLRKDAGLPEDAEGASRKRKRGKDVIVDVRALDVGAKEIEINLADSTTVRVLLSKRGVVEKAVARNSDGIGRVRAVERALLAGDRRVEGIVERLTKLQDVDSRSPRRPQNTYETA
ncbi:cenp-o kinetochore centromere component [Diplodia corticola]|uniref:Cenp-o kinetochore centromere component n=1 Tax=Diplodia corticola TaxID=236234 RepID=A0A1J9SCQ1_9PEZI|nr:cenp-o kinetochore centromere component [Diplodia corticola]OJD37349.1 cenp-o kinetochore centromere component [Diplodia corticola]